MDKNKINFSLIEFYNYTLNNNDRCYYVNNNRFYCFENKIISDEFINYEIYFTCDNSFETGQIRRPIVLDFLGQLLRKEKINNILKNGNRNK